MAAKHLSDLSAPRQALLRLFQILNYGAVIGLAVRNGEPVFHPELAILQELKLDQNERPRPEADLADFALRDEVCRLLAHIDDLQNGSIERIEVRAGVPRRVVVERRLAEAF